MSTLLIVDRRSLYEAENIHKHKRGIAIELENDNSTRKGGICRPQNRAGAVFDLDNTIRRLSRLHH